MTDDILQTYFDDDGNMIFQDQYLEERTQEQVAIVNKKNAEDPICQAGSLLEYAIKKEKLLLEVRKTIDEGTLIDIIAAGLPDFITDRINKEEILHTRDLFNEVGKLEHLVTKKKFIKKEMILS
ncbi:hypothetical protein ILUMI_17760 [Ignelater luminosus]|uniref:Uncharacterized protein n=1 Tax=Ignelater luminosus TaxID=2038154 RepID=A0A8K0CJA7_IGNLU|nr:hypothetical protein ILUMI_17760 [Ignelater luminosus]